MGHGISEALAAAGWNLVITDRKAGRGEAFARRIREQGRQIEVVVADVTEPDAPARAVRAALDRFGRLDGLVNNVGIGLAKRVGEVTDEELQGLFNVDFLASFRFVRAALPSLLATQGAVVNIGSVHARLAAEKFALYAAIKSALDAFTRGLAVDYGSQGLRANIVHPGLVESEQNDAILKKITADPAQWIHEFTATKQCLPRVTTARDVGELVAFLLGRGAAAITGQSIFVDGGTTTLMWNKETNPGEGGR